LTEVDAMNRSDRFPASLEVGLAYAAAVRHACHAESQPPPCDACRKSGSALTLPLPARLVDVS
jgi:hypothetical protein